MNRSLTYRVAILVPDAQRVLVERRGGRATLPRVSVRKGMRAVRQIQMALWSRWGLRAVVLDFVCDESGVPLCVAELRSPISHTVLQAISLEVVSIGRLQWPEVEPHIRSVIQEMALGIAGSRSPLSRLGWLNEATTWIESNLGNGAGQVRDLEQYTAGGGFALFKVKTAAGRLYWFKAVGEPNLREFAVTKILAAACPDQLPALLAVNDDWNAWLMQDAGKPRTAGFDRESLCDALTAFAQIQRVASTDTDALIQAGACDHRSQALRSAVRALVPFLQETMHRQSTTAVTTIADARIEEIGAILEDACEAMAGSRIPETIVHNDVNAGNILFQRDRCIFIDWCEVSIGSPFLFFQNMLRLAERGLGKECNLSKSLRDRYSECWHDVLTDEQMDIGFSLAPLLAVFSYLSRYVELLAAAGVDEDRLGLVRSLVRHLDREAGSPRLCGILRG